LNNCGVLLQTSSQGPLIQRAHGPGAAGATEQLAKNFLLPHHKQNGANSNCRIEYGINTEFLQMEEMSDMGGNTGKSIIDLLFFLSH